MVHSKQQLLKFLEQNITDRVLQNILNRGRIEFLGGFNPLLNGIPGWVVQLTSRFGVVHYIAIIENTFTGNLHWVRLADVPWQRWDGDKSDDELYCGDRPEAYLGHKLIAQKNLIDEVTK